MKSFPVITLLLFAAIVTNCCAGQFSDLVRKRIEEMKRSRQDDRAPADTTREAQAIRYCPACGAELPGASGLRFCPACGAELPVVVLGNERSAERREDPRANFFEQARWLEGFWLSMPEPTAIPLHNDVICHAMCCQLLWFEFHRRKGIIGRYTYIDYRRIYELPGLHRNDIEERQRPKRFQPEIEGDQVTFGFDMNLHSSIFRRNVRLSYKRHYVCSFRLHAEAGGTRLVGSMERDFQHEGVVFVKISEKRGRWLINNKNRRREIENKLMAVKNTLKVLRLAEDAPPEAAARERLLKAFSAREVFLFDDRDNLIKQISSLKSINATLESRLDEAEDALCSAGLDIPWKDDDDD